MKSRIYGEVDMGMRITTNNYPYVLYDQSIFSVKVYVMFISSHSY